MVMDTENKYECPSHKFDLSCMGCVYAMKKRHDAMLSFMRNLKNSNRTMHSYYLLKEEAKQLLTEIGK